MLINHEIQTKVMNSHQLSCRGLYSSVQGLLGTLKIMGQVMITCKQPAIRLESVEITEEICRIITRLMSKKREQNYLLTDLVP